MILPFQHIKNGRDLGGLPAAEGKAVKTGVLLRTGELFEADDRDILALSNDYQLKAVIDLRDISECKLRPDKEIPGAVYHHLSVMSPQSEEERDKLRSILMEDPKTAFLTVYQSLAESNTVAATYRKFFEIILKTAGKPVLYHCRQGKDRTGIATILLLTALGVPQAEIRSDYFLTNELLRPEFESLKTQGLPEDQLAKAEFIMFVMEDCIDHYLSIITKNWGGVPGYLKDGIGLNREEITLLRHAYTK